MFNDKDNIHMYLFIHIETNLDSLLQDFQHLFIQQSMFNEPLIRDTHSNEHICIFLILFIDVGLTFIDCLSKTILINILER